MYTNVLLLEKKCDKDAVYNDDITGDSAYCTNHVLVSEDILQYLEDSRDSINDTMYKELRQIQMLDSELVKGDIHEQIDGHLTLTDTNDAISAMARERYMLAKKYGLGTHPDIVSLFFSACSSSSVPIKDSDDVGVSEERQAR